MHQGRSYLQAKGGKGRKQTDEGEEVRAALHGKHGPATLLPERHREEKAQLRAVQEEQYGHWHFLLRWAWYVCGQQTA